MVESKYQNKIDFTFFRKKWTEVKIILEINGDAGEGMLWELYSLLKQNDQNGQNEKKSFMMAH